METETKVQTAGIRRKNKSIVVITGSARKDGNSDLMAKAFIDGAKEAGHCVFLFETRNKKLLPCLGCHQCFTKWMACSQSDDFNELASILETVDTIVFCSPLYWYSFPAKMKMIIDKLHSFLSAEEIGITEKKNRELKIKEAAMLVCGETDDKNDFAGIVKTFELMLNFKKWKNAGMLTVLNVKNIDDIKDTDGLEKAKNMGKNI